MVSHVGFTGTRRGMTLAQRRELRAVLKLTKAEWLHHGDCKGADFEAHLIAEDMNINTWGHPPTESAGRAFCEFDEFNKPKPYLERNRSIVDSTGLLIAAPRTLDMVLRSGTWATVRYARKQKRPLIILRPGGGTVVENWP